MFRLFAAAAFVAALAPLAAAQQPTRRPVPEQVAAIDRMYADLDKAGLLTIREKTRDAGNRNFDVVVLTAVGGRVEIPPGATRYFQIDKGKDPFTASGGWAWTGGGGMEKTRIRGAEYVKAVRDPAGFTDWYWVERAPNKK